MTGIQQKSMSDPVIILAYYSIIVRSNTLEYLISENISLVILYIDTCMYIHEILKRCIIRGPTTCSDPVGTIFGSVRLVKLMLMYFPARIILYYYELRW